MSIFLEILQWTDHGASEMVHRIPEDGSADIKMGAQLIVESSQRALFMRDGKCMDQFGPGRHVLSTANLPIITRFLSLPYGFKSPFRAAVYFVNQKVFTDLTWGTKNPVIFRDRELGVVRLRGYGRFNLRVADPALFLNTVVGSRPVFDVEEIQEYFRDVIVSRLNDFLGEQAGCLYDLPALYNEIGAAAKVRIRDDFRRYGCELVEFYVNSITPPEAVQEMIDERSGLNAVGDLNDFLRFEAARAVGGHGAAAGGSAGAAMQTGVGAGVGLALVPNLLQGAVASSAKATAVAEPVSFAGRAPAGQSAEVPSTGVPSAEVQVGAAAGEAVGAVILSCSRCQAHLGAGSKYCTVCGQEQAHPMSCATCQGALPVNARFCPGCGNPVRRSVQP